MNTSFRSSVIDSQEEYVESLKAELQKAQEDYALLEQKYCSAINRCNILEQEISLLSGNQENNTVPPINMEEIATSLKQISACINESLAHGWSASNHVLFKISNKLAKLMEHTDQTRIHNIMEPLDRGNAHLNELLDKYYRSVMPKPMVSEGMCFDSLAESTQHRMRTILHNEYRKFDVLVFGTIDYNYLYQRPQHFADYFAEQGHRVFYINASFHHGYDFRISQRKENLFLVTLPCFSADAVYAADLSQVASEVSISLNNLLFQYCIKDAVLIADHPNWVHTLVPLKSKHGFKIVTDYMDDFTGFENDEQELVVNSCRLLLQSSDLVVASSIYLQQQAAKFNDNVALIRNGTDFAHFNAACKEGANTAKKTIGYYGVISSWFDYQKIKYLSNRFPQHDIVLIGDVLESKKKFFNPLRNVQLTGVKPYTVLPEYLKEFDVCLIPFDSSLNLIKATNPVKFYEYLSAAKKIVATEMPELEPFRNKFVYLANDDKTFGDYVELCLNGRDTLARPEECIEFARENDWQQRAKHFVECIKAQFPKVNIIIEDSASPSSDAYKEALQAATAYPNFDVYSMQDVDASVLYDCDYISIVKRNTAFSRGWLTALVHHTAESFADAACPVTYTSCADGNQRHLPTDMYMQCETQNTHTSSTTVSDACIVLPAKHLHGMNLSVDQITIKQIKESNLNIIAVDSALTNNN